MNSVLLEMPYCAACGRWETSLGEGYLAAELLHPSLAHDRWTTLTLCPEHRVWKNLGPAHRLWLKKHRDPCYYDEGFLREWWEGDFPEPEEPRWLRAEFAANQSRPDDDNPVSLLEMYGLPDGVLEQLHEHGIVHMTDLDKVTWPIVQRRWRGFGEASWKELTRALRRYRNDPDKPTDWERDPEIAKRQAEVRDSWSEEERARRRVWQPDPLVVPTLHDPREDLGDRALSP